MTRYLLKQKLLAFGDDFAILDEAGREAFRVDGKAFSLGNQLAFLGPDGAELAYIRQKLLAWGPTYEISRGNRVVAVLAKDRF